jgi:NitT/TauT family transport system ATP-binding protein/nitrate/nitrite transport system substrate-binding protein
MTLELRVNAHTEVPNRPHSRRAGPGLRTLRLGFVPLTDAAPLLVAEALGLFDAVGIRVSLSAETGWAALRDKLAFGALDAAHLLGPMPIALAAGLDGVRAEVTVAAGLGASGNTITVSKALAEEIGPFRVPLSPTAFAGAVRRRQGKHGGRGAAEVKLAVVFPYSSHNYLLRYWLAKGGLDPDRDLRLVVVPPPLVAKMLDDGIIDGFCAGEPWGSHAAALGAGRIALATGDIWPNHPEKLLALRRDYVAREPEMAAAVTAAVIAAARWLDDPDNQREAVNILQKRAFPSLERDSIAAAFEGRAMDIALRHPLRFRGATLPRRDQAAWWLRQMRHWGHVPEYVSDTEALAPWSEDLWRAAAARLREAEPPAAPPPPVDLPETLGK